MAEITDLKLSVVGPEGEEAADKTITAKVPTDPPTKVTLKATVMPADAAVTAWVWKKDDTDPPLPGHDGEYVIDQFTKQSEGSYTVTATADGKSKTSNAVVLVAKTETETPAADGSGNGDIQVREVEVGEYDPVFAYAALVAVVVLASMALLLLNWKIKVELPKLTGSAPESGTYAERLRAYAVVAASSAGLLALMVGAWLAAVEVRGRVRRTVAVASPTAAATGRGAAEEVSKVLEAAGRVRGTIGVLASAVALLLGVLWAVGQSPDAASQTTTTTTTTATTLTTPTAGAPTTRP